MMATLESLRDSLADIDGVASAKIGIESNISPADYPLIRVVPERISTGAYKQRAATCLIYFGMAISEQDNAGLEGVYSALFEMDDAIRAVIHAAGGRYIETVTDEDRMDTYKVMVIRCEIFG